MVPPWLHMDLSSANGATVCVLKNVAEAGRGINVAQHAGGDHATDHSGSFRTGVAAATSE